MINLITAIEDFKLYLRGLRKSENTIKSYNSDLKEYKAFVLERYGSLIIEEDSFKQSVMNYIDTLRYYNEDKEYLISTLNRKRICMRKFVIFLSRREYINNNFSAKIELIKTNSYASKDILEINEITAVKRYIDDAIASSRTFSQKCKAVRNGFIFYTLLYTGLRVSEMTSLKWSNIDYERNFILVANGKGNKQRTIPINPEYKLLIDEYRNFLLDEYRDDKIISGYIFPRNERNLNISLTPKTVRCIIREIMEGIKIENKHISPHNLRHTFASHSIFNNVSITALANILGHKRNSITLDIYGHLINESQKQSEITKLSYSV